MSSILIPATKSLTVTNKFPNRNINEGIITVGKNGIYNYVSYLFFDISAIPSNVCILNAELVLFKTNNFYEDRRKKAFIYPLLDYFSTYTTYNNHPEINNSIEKAFCPMTSKVAVRVNLTCLVTLWINNKQPNTGIALFDINNEVFAEFGSAICTDSYLVPFIDVSIDNSNNCNCQDATKKQVQVIGTVAAASKYEAIVNIAVKRKDSGYIDNYYVVDEYDNSLNGNPLKINKSYNMAIVPKVMPGDTETAAFYGSYKEE